MSTSKAPLPESNKGPADPAPALTVDYSQLHLGENKSFVDAWDEAFKWNEEAARVKGEELASLMALKMIHAVSPSVLSLQTVVTWVFKVGASCFTSIFVDKNLNFMSVAPKCRVVFSLQQLGAEDSENLSFAFRF